MRVGCHHYRQKASLYIVLAAIMAVLCVGWGNPAYALREPRPMTIDGRLKTLMYHPYEVYKFTGYFYFQTIIELEPGEKVNTISMGIPDGWQIQPANHRIFVKPIALNPEDALTNMTIITDKRMYFFEMHAAEAEDVTSQDIPFVVSFVYPESSVAAGVAEIAAAGPNTKNPERLNYNYTVSGDDVLSPVQIFDDGLFTYFKFRPNSPLPAFFEVDNEGYEALVNYRIERDGEENYVVIEDILPQFTLRYGDQTACVFNESKPLKIKEVERKGPFGWW